MWKFKCLKGKDKWLFLLTIGVILCILAFPVGTGLSSELQTKGEKELQDTSSGQGEKEEVAAAAAPAASKASDAYEAELEQRVRQLLKTVDGVGEVDVMIVLKSSEEKVIRVDKSNTSSTTKETDSGGGNRNIESEERTESTVLTSGDGKNVPIVEKELRPEISGIIISAAGGGSPTVCAEISAAMEALFDLPAHKIKVLKRVE